MIFSQTSSRHRYNSIFASTGSRRSTAPVKFLVVLLGAVLPCSFIGCQAPAPVLEAEGMASKLEQEYRTSIDTRLDQWSDQLGEAWERELQLIILREIEKVSVDGRVESSVVLQLLKQQQEARKKNRERLTTERKADDAASRAVNEAARLRESIRQWLASGMSREKREEVYTEMGKVINERTR